jgi:YHS domain-containing protein
VPAAEFLLEHMSRSLFDPVDTTHVASLSPRLRAHVNGEIYRFAGPVTLARFRRAPLRWCGILRDPVSGVRFLPDAASPRCDMADGPYFFATDSTLRAFCADTARYAIRREY